MGNRRFGLGPLLTGAVMLLAYSVRKAKRPSPPQLDLVDAERRAEESLAEVAERIKREREEK